MYVYLCPNKAGSNSSQLTDPADLIRVVATNRATADQKRLFHFNVLKNPAFRSEIYYQQKTYKLNDAPRYERRLLTTYKQCMDEKTLPLAPERPQAEREPNRRPTPRPSAASRPNAPPRESSRGTTAPGPGTPESSAPRRDVAQELVQGLLKLPPPVAVAARCNEDASFHGFWSPPRAGARPGPGLGNSAPGRFQGDSAPARQPNIPPPTHPPPEQHIISAPPPSHQHSFPSHVPPPPNGPQTHGRTPLRRPPAQSQQHGEIIGLVITHEATMAELDAFEHRIKSDKDFHVVLIQTLDRLKAESAVDDVERLLNFIHRVALCHLFQL
jgi:hypothetical protein